ncbi:MAG: hypothetical protein KDB27_30615 [Planctomycetales bacterium]|nr:hypothetical protein [Planctomycetales bacterium]
MMKRLAFVLALTGLISVTPVQGGLVVHYTFDDVDVDGDAIKDISGNGLDGIKINDGPTTGFPGKIGQAASFAGGANNQDNDYVDMSAHADSLGQLTEGTLAAWVKPVTTEEAGGPDGHLTDVLTIFAASDSTQGSAEMRWVVHTTTSPFSPGGPGGAVGHGGMYLGARGVDFPDHLINDVDDEVSLLDGNWHHVAVTVDGDNEGTLFIDGGEVESYYLTGDAISFMGDIIPDGPDTLGIGRNKDSTAGGGQWFYHGLIDDFRIYDDALPADAIKALFDSAAADPCDFDGNGTLDIGDLDLLVAAVRDNSGDATFDVNGDGTLTAADVQVFVESPDKLNTYVGDANLDGEFNSGDFVTVFTAGLYETGQPATWSSGDWNADGKFDSGDFVAAFASSGYENGERGVRAAAVPEPSVVSLISVGMLVHLRRRR